MEDSSLKKIKLTVAQAIIQYLNNQYIDVDGNENKFFSGCFGILGHGNVAGIGQAIQEQKDLKYYQFRNEQSMVHSAAAYAKMKNRKNALICTSSIGPGSTNMLTAAAGATINRLPVLLLSGDIFAKRNVSPALQQLESNSSQDISVNDCFKPISKYWDRINRPEQLLSSLPEVMRILVSPSETGTVMLSLPQDVQSESFNFPCDLFKKKIWKIQRQRADKDIIKKAIEWIKKSKKPLIIAGGGIHYSEATEELKKFVDITNIPVAETFAGKGALKYNDSHQLGAIGVTGTFGAVKISKESDLIIGIGTRYSDFTTSSKTAFQNKNVKFININNNEFDAAKNGALMVQGDAKAILKELNISLSKYKVDKKYSNEVKKLNLKWDDIVSKIYNYRNPKIFSQGEIIGAVNNFMDDKDVVVCAAGSLPGDLHKLWRTKDHRGFHLEYGYSCMGYEIAGGLGIKMADPSREIYVMVGDGSYLMLAQEIVTSIQENLKLTIVLIDNQGYKSIGSLSRSLGSKGFGTRFSFRNEKKNNDFGDNQPKEKEVKINLAKNAKSLGAHVFKCENYNDLENALKEAKSINKTTVIYTQCDRFHELEGYSWWEVPVAETSKINSVNKAYKIYLKQKKNQRFYN